MVLNHHMPFTIEAEQCQKLQMHGSQVRHRQCNGGTRHIKRQTIVVDDMRHFYTTNATQSVEKKTSRNRENVFVFVGILREF